MASFFSFSQPNFYEGNSSSLKNQESVVDAVYQQPTDPWNLGISTSTSTTESIAEQSNNDSTLLSTTNPRTPKGLRPRRSIESIRKDLLGCNQYTHESKNSYNKSTATEAKSRSSEILERVHHDLSSLPVRRSCSSLGKKCDIRILPSSLEGIHGSPIHSTSSFYEQSVEGSNNFIDEDFDIDSSAENSIFSRQSRCKYRSRQIAVSPDLNRGGKAKTAVGALLVAMVDTSQKPKTSMSEKLSVKNERHHNPILPSRSWMEKQRTEDGYLLNDQIDEDDTIRDDSNRVFHFNDENQSSPYASPSSLRRGVISASWIHQQHNIQNDSSFTRKILDDDPSSSRLEERSTLGHSPYDFNPIMDEDISSEMATESINAPRLLSLVKNAGRLNLSAISDSHHHKDIESINTSLADTIDYEEEEYREIPMYYQALVDDVPSQNMTGDDALVKAKVQNQRRDKEVLLRSTLERLQDCLEILKEIYSQSSMDSSLFLGLGKSKGDQCYKNMQVLLLELQEGNSNATRKQALSFFMSVLKTTDSGSHNAIDSKLSSLFPTNLLSPHWVPIPGFRSLLGLQEDPQSPRTIRGGDTSLFSLPSDSLNESTPHTSNVSIATTITTVVSPEKYGPGVYKQQQQRSSFPPSDQNKANGNQGIRATIEYISRLLYRLEEVCRDEKFKMNESRKSKFMENIENIYLRFLSISAVDLRLIVNSFEMEFFESQNLRRTVTNDQDVSISHSRPPFSGYQNDGNVVQDIFSFSKDTLHVNIVQCDDDDVDNDNRNQSIECGIWSPTTNDMMSLVSPPNEAENRAVTNAGYSELVDDEPVDDLRRTTNSFDERNVGDEREAAPLFDESEANHAASFPATFARRIVAQRSKKSRFWKKRFLALKNRGRQATAE